MTATSKFAPADSAAARQRHIDSLVATYAPLGRRHRKSVRRKRFTVLATLSAFLVAGSALLLTDVQIPFGSNGDDQRFVELRELLTTELSAISAERQELERYKQIFAERNDVLNAQIAAVNSQWSDLEDQRSQFETQSTLLTETLNEIDAQRRNLQRRRDPGQLLDEEINAISSQRQALEKRWKQFEAQGELLATEIIAVNAQRRELEAQRQLMQRQQKQLQALIDRAIDNDDRSRAAAASTGKAEPAARTYSQEAEQMVAYAGSSTVADGTLGEMRGGINIGGDMEVALGVTHTGSINGVEQYSNSFVIGDLNADMSTVDLSNMNATLIQKGDGNHAASSVVDSLTGSFGSVIQNTLDDQTIATASIYDISIANTAGAVQGLAATQALTDSLNFSQ